MNKVQRKFRKLMRDPKLFFSDMLLKRRGRFGKRNCSKYNSVYQYAIISAVYNSEKYLDDYFESITTQSLDFEKHIQIILVDDGSTDSSAEIIRKWKEKYPNNIKYIYKENGGQGSARNIGLMHLKADYVSFMDSDDFLDQDYLYYVDKAITNNNKIKMVCCNQIYYFEDKGLYVDRHPLNYRFKTKNNIVPCTDLGSNIQFSAALSFLRVDSIPKTLKFDEELKPTFEDGKFVNIYLLNQTKDSYVYFEPKARYWNRKRADKSSTMDGIWKHKGTFSTVFERGYLDILAVCKTEKGFIPKHLQRTILWEMLKLVKQLVNHEERASILSEKEKQHFLKLMDATFQYIDKETIMSYELGNCGFSRQLGMLGCFKKLDVDRQVAYIDRIDAEKNQFLLRYFSCFTGDYQIKCGDEELIPTYYKKSVRRLLSRVFLTEHRLWLPIPKEGVVEVNIDGKIANINFNGNRYKNGISVNQISCFNKNINGCWVLMDRDDSAGDNAEFLYKYIRDNHKDKSIFFILDKSSSDWKRLKLNGFNLVSHGSKKHKEVLEKCSVLISSQIGSILVPFENIKNNYKTIFLQHGVTKDNISEWLNNVKMDLILTATKGEHNSIISNDSSYIYGDKETKLVGFPRFDSLYVNRKNFKQKIMIMFTWRKSIAGNFVSNKKSEREFNNEFQNTLYYRSINGFFSHPRLSELSSKFNVEFSFVPHPNMRPYLKLFELPKYVRAISDNQTIHNLINESAMVVTDYSSIAFDFAYQNKPICYYQFDKEDFFSGEHTYTTGYFDYERDGFGSVYDNLESVIDFLYSNISKGYKNDKLFSDRIKNSFKFIDNRNCERAYNAISECLEYDMRILNSDSDRVWLHNKAEESYLSGNFRVALFRYEKLLKMNSERNVNLNYLDRYIRLLLQLGKYQEALRKIDELDKSILNNEHRVEILRGLFYFYTSNFDIASEILSPHVKILKNSDLVNFARCQFMIGNKEHLSKIVIENKEQVDVYELELISLLNMNLGNNEISFSSTKLESLSQEEKRIYNVDLILSEILYRKGDFNSALNKIVELEDYFKPPMRRFLIALISYKQGNFSKVVRQIEALDTQISLFGKDIIEIYNDSKGYK